MNTRFCTCPLCEAMCGLELGVEEGQLVHIRGDRLDPLSLGFLCPKAMALPDLLKDSSRLTSPLIRQGGDWRKASWKEAIGFAAERLAEIQRRYGRDSIAFYTGNPNLHSYAAQLVELEFAAALRTRNLYSTASVDHLPHLFASYYMFGHQLLLPVPDIDRTSCLLVFGANPAESNGSLMSAPGMPRRLRDIQSRGGKVFVFDPRRTLTAELATHYLPIRPGSDALLLLALINTLFAEGLVACGRIDAFVKGIETLRHWSKPFTPERVEGQVGITAGDIRGLAREITASPSVCYGRLGVCTQEFGSACQWLINSVNILTGNFDRPGGAMFPRPAVDIVRVGTLLGQRGSHARWHSRVRRLPEFGGQLPVAALGEEMNTRGPGQVRALITSAGNPVLSTPNGSQLESGLRRLDFMIAMDFYINETTRHADVILPPTCALERDHYDVVFRAFGVRDTVRYTNPVFEPAADSRHDWQIYCRLGAELCKHRNGAGDLYRRIRLEALERVTPRRILSLLLRTGPHHLSIKKLEQANHTLDLGALTPCLPQRLGTSDKKIDSAPAIFHPVIQQLESKLDEKVRCQSLLLIGRRQIRTNNSWMHRFSRLSRPSDKCTLLLHPEDARERGLNSGEMVEIRSRTGTVRTVVKISDSMSKGVVSLPHGFQHASANDLTDELHLDQLTGTAALNGIPVELTRIVNPGMTQDDIALNSRQSVPEELCQHS